MSDDEALRPTFSVTEPTEVEEIQVEDEESQVINDAVADLKDHIGFQKIRQNIQDKIASYRGGERMKITGKEDFEEIGRKYLVSSLVASELEAVLGDIDAAAYAKEQRGE